MTGSAGSQEVRDVQEVQRRLTWPACLSTAGPRFESEFGLLVTPAQLDSDLPRSGATSRCGVRSGGGIHPAYTVEVGPESPARGWRCPTYTFNETGVAAAGLDAIGSTLLVRFTAATIEWIWRFVGGGSGSISSVLATPNPGCCCVIADGRAYLIDVEASPPRAEVVMDWVRSAETSSSPPLLVLADWTNAAAVGPEGVRWRTERLAIDDLTIVAITLGGVVLECDNPGVGGVREIVLDPQTGRQISGPTLPDAFR